MSDDLPNQNKSNSWGAPQSVAPEVPSAPNPPLTATNSTVDPVQSWVAQHEQRDNSGKFVKSDHLTNRQTNSTPINGHNSSAAPLPIQVTENNKYSEKNDPPMVDLKVTNPVTYFKKWVGKFFKNQDIDIHLKIKPFATIGLILAFSAVGGASYSLGFNSAISKFFPNSSPILHRAISLQGIIQRSETGSYYLSLPDNTLWTLKPTNNNISLTDYINKSVVVKGNLNSEPNIIEVKEIITFDKPTPAIYAPTQSSATNSGKIQP